MATNLTSLQGKIMLAKIVNGVVGASFPVGNAPDFKISTDADVIKHTESMSGQRTTDFTMTKTRSVMFEGELEEIDENIIESWPFQAKAILNFQNKNSISEA